MFAVWIPHLESRSPNPRPEHSERAPTRTRHRVRVAPLDGRYCNAFRIEDRSNGNFRIVRTVAELQECLDDEVMAAVLHWEGADAIDTDLDTLRVLYRAGLRSLGLVWGRPNAFAEGVAVHFRRSPDTGPGLTDAGRELVRACNDRIMIDVSHLNERGFWDVAALTDAPLVASHSNAYALCPSAGTSPTRSSTP